MTVKAIGGRGLEFRADDKNGNYIGTWHWTGAPRASVVFAAHAVKPDERARALDVLPDFSGEDSGPAATVMVFHHGGAGEPISFSLDGA